MKKILSISTVLLLAAIYVQVHAQSQEDMKKWMDYMTPGDMHQMLAKSNGDWNEEITQWMAPGAPPMQYTATCTNKMIMGGRYQQSMQTGSFNGMDFEGESTVGYDNAKKVFVMTWIDNLGTGIVYMEGTYDAATKTATFTGKETDPMSGKDMDIKQTMQFADDNTQFMDMYSTQNGQEFKMLEVKFTRK